LNRYLIISYTTINNYQGIEGTTPPFQGVIAGMVDEGFNDQYE